MIGGLICGFGVLAYLTVLAILERRDYLRGQR